MEAGLRRVNVSLDSLDHTRFQEITRRDMLDRVLDGLAEAERYPELRPIKVNCVAMRGVTEQEVLAFAELARSRPFVVRFIEFMPLDADEAWNQADVIPGEELRAMIEAVYPLVPLDAPASSTARRFAVRRRQRRARLHQPGHASRSAPPATASASPPTACCGRASSRWRRPTCARRCATARATRTSSPCCAARMLGKRMKHAIGEPGFVRTSRSMSQIGG